MCNYISSKKHPKIDENCKRPSIINYIQSNKKRRTQKINCIVEPRLVCLFIYFLTDKKSYTTQTETKLTCWSVHTGMKIKHTKGKNILKEKASRNIIFILLISTG
jgi:hypothetical protein